jgi:K+-sensing histidine kinase KdpD
VFDPQDSHDHLMPKALTARSGKVEECVALALLREIGARAMRTALPRPLPPLLRYGFALATVAAVVAIEWIFHLHLGRDAPFMLMLGPTLLSAWFGGLGPGVVAAVLGSAAVMFFFLPPELDFRTTPLAAIHTLIFGTMNVVTAVLLATLRSSLERAEDAARRIEGVYAVSVALGGTRSAQEAAEVVLKESVRVLGAAGVVLYLVTERGDALRMVSHLGVDTRYLPIANLPPFVEVPMSLDTVVTQAARTRSVSCLESEEEFRGRFPERHAATQGQPIPPALACAPMIVSGHVIGVLAIVFPRERRLSQRDRAWIKAVAQDCGMALERTRLFERERSARIEAQEASRAKDEFLAVVSNELRAPLTTIVGWAHVLKRPKGMDRERYEHGLDVIERSAQAQARLVDDVIDMSRIVARKLKVEAKTLDLVPLVREVVEELQGKATSKGVHLHAAANGPAKIVGDAARLRQVLEKILANSLRFTPPGGHVTVETERTEHRVLVRIRDDGKGIDGGALPVVLEPFRRGDATNSRVDRGLGLGLPIANYIVHEHNGSLRIESPGAGHGTTVTIDLPLVDAAADVLARVPAHEPGVHANRLAGMRVLVVDDDTDAREVLTELFNAEGADVRSTPSTAVAIDQVREFFPNVVVSDVDAPNADHSFIRALRALPPPLDGVPALALTARTRPEEAAAAIAAGYQRQINKPPEPRELTETVAQLGATEAT